MFCFLLLHWCEGLSIAEFRMGQKSPNVNRNSSSLWTFVLGQVEIHLEEIHSEGLLVSWTFEDRPDLELLVLPRLELPEVSG